MCQNTTNPAGTLSPLTALREKIRNIESTMKDPTTKSSEIENLRPLWLRLKARLAKASAGRGEM